MNKTEFIEKLREGLQGVSPDERVAALLYYTEYLDDAGPEREAEVLEELGSPEKIAADIRADSEADGWVPPDKEGENAGDIKLSLDPGESAAQVETPAEPTGPAPTEAAFGMGAAPGAPNPPPPPGAQANQTQAGAGPMPPPHGYGPNTGGAPQGAPYQPGGQGYPPPKLNNDKKVAVIVLIVILCILFSPAIIGLLGGLFGLLVGLFVVLLVPLIVGLSLVAGGVFAIVVGSFGFSISGPAGLVSVGLGILITGLGLLCTFGGIMILVKLIPAVVRGVINLFRKIFKREKKQPVPPAA